MTAEKQRIAIAEACGWKLILADCWEKDGRYAGVCGRPDYAQLPDYLNDLNAMHEAEKVLRSQGQFGEYTFTLAGLNDAAWKHGANFARIAWESMLFRVAQSTAAERAEAFLRTLNLWKD